MEWASREFLFLVAPGIAFSSCGGEFACGKTILQKDDGCIGREREEGMNAVQLANFLGLHLRHRALAPREGYIDNYRGG